MILIRYISLRLDEHDNYRDTIEIAKIKAIETSLLSPSFDDFQGTTKNFVI